MVFSEVMLCIRLLMCCVKKLVLSRLFLVR